MLLTRRGSSLIGIGEIVLLPLDVLKIKRQTNPDAFRGRGLFKIISDEGFGLYRGAAWTAARNAPGSFAVRILSSPLPLFLFSIRISIIIYKLSVRLTLNSSSVVPPSPRNTSTT